MNKVKSIILLVFVVGIFSLLFYGFSTSDSVSQTKVNSKSFNEKYSIIPVKIPSEIYFAGERVPIENFDTYESLDRELLINTYWQSQTLLFLKKAHRYFPLIEEILEKNGVPADLKYLAVAESGLTNVVSPSNAVGFWQFLKGTGQDYKLEVNDEVDERYHLEKSTEAAAKYLKESYDKYGTWSMAAASYNMGRRNISKYRDKQKTNNYYDLILGEETGRYVFRLIALKLILESPETYGFEISDEEKYSEIPYKIAVVDSSIQSMPHFANTQGINYKMLKELNPWLRDDHLTNKSGKSYEIKIASNKYRTISPNPMFFPEK